ncbi:helix-turn-helix domain-containing protein [Alkalibacterium sp. MB6]|uniref:helix-turn-helix domain-containing protein n=1 Tax=Alkalibacterium sp. MB6 TaxID=2081965 RepID=UPI00137B3C6E|nr:helix-turn-helix domain-containing protein [Alkalibacterium sp. MB6]
MTNIHTNLNSVMDLIIDTKIEQYEQTINEKLSQLERKLLTAHTNPNNEILQQKEVFELLGIGRRRLKNWVDRGLKEIRIDNRVYYRYSELMNFIENSKP